MKYFFEFLNKQSEERTVIYGIIVMTAIYLIIDGLITILK